MSSQKPKKHKILKVQVSYEASRVASECLADAYELVVPLVHRVTPASSEFSPVDLKPDKRTVGDGSLFGQSDFG